MPPDFPAWILLAVGTATIVWSIPKLLAFLIDAMTLGKPVLNLGERSRSD